MRSADDPTGGASADKARSEVLGSPPVPVTEAEEPTDLIEYRELRESLRALVDTLPPREAMIICLRYGLHDGKPCTLHEVAERLGLTVAQTRVREREAAGS